MKRVTFAWVLLSAVALLAPPAGAATEDIKVCKLLTKKEASRILGEKVVKAEAERDDNIDAAECDYRTKKFSGPELKELDAPILLSVDIQGLTDELRAELENRRADGEDIEGIADVAFRTSSGSTIALVGDIGVEASYSNAGSTPSDIAAEKETAALRLAVRRIVALTSG
jgi:hypothetical protein